jgi:hypothetical protein
VLFVGDSGTAKSVTISNYLGGLSPEQYLVLNMNFSSRTSSMDVQRSVEDAVEKRTKVSGPTPSPMPAHKKRSLCRVFKNGQKVKVLVSFEENCLSVSRVGVCGVPEQIVFLRTPTLLLLFGAPRPCLKRAVLS